MTKTPPDKNRPQPKGDSQDYSQNERINKSIKVDPWGPAPQPKKKN